MADTPHTDHPHSHEPARRTNMIANILAFVGFLILIVIIFWGLFHLVRLATPWFSGIFGGNDSEIIVTAPAQVTTGTPLAISWKYDTSTRGTYAFLYQCVEGLQMTVGANKIPCGAAYTLGNATGTATMIPTLTGTNSLKSNISVLFIPSEVGTTGPEASGSAAVQIVSGSVGTPVVTPKPTPTSKPKPTSKPVSKPTYVASKPASAADLSVRIVAVGVIDSYTGAFVKRAPYSPSEISAVQFDIQNVGGSHSGQYTFQAQIPTSQPYTYSSQAQPSLAPSAHVVNTLRFSPAVNGTFSVQVIAYDARTSNNYASQWVTGAAQYNQYPMYPQQPQYPTYPQYPVYPYSY